MEVDEDIDGGLLRQFNCMNTNDKDALMKEFQNLVGVNLNEQSATFYLDMTDWNLQAAVCAYFDLQSANKLPQMSFIKDITIGEGESVPPITRFIKTWRIKNHGDELWPHSCILKFTGGQRLGAPDQIPIPSLLPGNEADISVELISPSETGYYMSKWRMSTPQGSFFGDAIWVIIQVDSGGTLALMQQMVNLKELGSPTHLESATERTTMQHQSSNPFAPANSLFSSTTTETSTQQPSNPNNYDSPNGDTPMT